MRTLYDVMLISSKYRYIVIVIHNYLCATQYTWIFHYFRIALQDDETYNLTNIIYKLSYIQHQIKCNMHNIACIYDCCDCFITTIEPQNTSFLNIKIYIYYIYVHVYWSQTFYKHISFRLAHVSEKWCNIASYKKIYYIDNVWQKRRYNMYSNTYTHTHTYVHAYMW